MADITLIQQAENSSNETTSCSLTLENCTVGNTLNLKSYAIYNIFKEKTAFNINSQYPEFLQKNSTLINLASDPDTLENITINY